jgi:hypothetical protein
MQLTKAEAAENVQKAEVELASAEMRHDNAKRACDEFLKAPQNADSVVRATELAKVFIESQKVLHYAKEALETAEKALLPFQIDGLRTVVSELEQEIDALEYQQALDYCRATDYVLSNKIKMLHALKEQYNEAEIAAGLKFRNNHLPHHTMIIKAAINGGAYDVMCSCGKNMTWSVDSSYPPACGSECKQCGKPGW